MDVPPPGNPFLGSGDWRLDLVSWEMELQFLSLIVLANLPLLWYGVFLQSRLKPLFRSGSLTVSSSSMASYGRVVWHRSLLVYRSVSFTAALVWYICCGVFDYLDCFMWFWLTLLICVSLLRSVFVFVFVSVDSWFLNGQRQRIQGCCCQSVIESLSFCGRAIMRVETNVALLVCCLGWFILDGMRKRNGIRETHLQAIFPFVTVFWVVVLIAAVGYWFMNGQRKSFGIFSICCLFCVFLLKTNIW